MRTTCVLLAWLAAALVTGATPSAQSDLDAFMERVLSRRDENWKKLQQYVLEEREMLRLTGPGEVPLYGFRREYSWFPRNGLFIRSPVTADGVTIGEDERRRAEAEWIERERRREQRRSGADAAAARPPDTPPADGSGSASATEAAIRDAIEPGFVSSAYFLRFKFDPGQYALAGRETLEGRDVLRIEYYPTRLFTEGRTRPNRRVRERNGDVTGQMNKSSLVTLWIDPSEHQILKYAFDNLEWDFLPGRSLVRIDAVNASMDMGQPFAGVWLPRSIRVGLTLTMALGEVDGRYEVDYHDYRLASVTTRIR